MKCLSNEGYVEVKDKSYIFHTTENNILRERKESKILRTQYQSYKNKKKSESF